MRRSFLGATAIACVVLVNILCVLWCVSMVTRIGIIPLGQDTSMNIVRGSIVLRHIYASAIAPPVPEDQWHDVAVARGWVTPRSPSGFPMPSFSSGHVMGQGGGFGPGALVSPDSYWLLRIP